MKNKAIYYIITITLMFLQILYYNNTSELNYDTSKIYGMITIIIFLIFFYILYKINKRIITSSSIFLTFLCLFSAGQTMLHTLNVDMDVLYIYNANDIEKIIEAQKYFNLSLCFYFLGNLFVEREEEQQALLVDDEYKIRAVKIVGYIFLTISFIPYMYNLFTTIVATMQSGYASLYENAAEGSVVNNIISYMSQYFILALILLFYANLKNKNRSRKYIVILVIVSILNLLTGSRGTAMSIIVIIILLYDIYIKRITKRHLFLLVFFTVILSYILSFILVIRSEEDKSFDSIIKAVESSTLGEENPVILLISELGNTMNAWLLTERVIPEEVEYKLGESYFASVMMIIPSFLLGGNSYANQAALDIWLQDTYNLYFGQGYSLIAETYYNFGDYGIIFTAILAIVYTGIFNFKLKKGSKDNNNIIKILSIVFLFETLIVARFPFHSTVRNIVYKVIIPYILIQLTYNTICKKNMKTLISKEETSEKDNSTNTYI